MTEPKRVTTSIKVNPDLWKKAKLYAVTNDMDLSDVVEDLIKKYIKEK